MDPFIRLVNHGIAAPDGLEDVEGIVLLVQRQHLNDRISGGISVDYHVFRPVKVLSRADVPPPSRLGSDRHREGSSDRVSVIDGRLEQLALYLYLDDAFH